MDAYSRGYIDGLEAATPLVESLKDTIRKQERDKRAHLETIANLAEHLERSRA